MTAPEISTSGDEPFLLTIFLKGHGMNDVSEAIKKVAENELSAVALAKELLDDGTKKVTVLLERRKIMPERMESPARSHQFCDVDGFTEYVGNNKTTDTVVFCDVNETTIFAVLDDKAPKGFEIITLVPPYHPEFALLAETLLDKTLGIQEFARAVMRNKRVIKDTAGHSARNLAMIMQQIVVASETKQFIGDGKKQVNGLVTKTTIKAGSDVTDELEIPDSFTVELPIYINTDPKRFDVDITITTKQQGVVAVVDCPELEVKKYEVFEEMVAGLKNLAGVSVVYGRPGRCDWNYNG